MNVADSNGPSVVAFSAVWSEKPLPVTAGATKFSGLLPRLSTMNITSDGTSYCTKLPNVMLEDELFSEMLPGASTTISGPMTVPVMFTVNDITGTENPFTVNISGPMTVPVMFTVNAFSVPVMSLL